MHSLRILIAHEHQTPPGQGGGGAESLLRDLTSALQLLGHEVLWWQGETDLALTIAAFRPDVVQLQTIHNFLGTEPAVYVQQSGIPHVWAVMDYWPFCRGRMLLLPKSDKSCSAAAGVCDNACGGRRPQLLELVNRSPVVALNQYTADIYRRNGLRCDYVVELGVDTEMFQPDPAERTPQPSVWTSSAWPEYAPKGMHVLRQAVDGTGLEVNLMAHTTRANVAKGLKRAHVYVFPSVYEETWGLSLCEAMASGCTCVASDVAGARAQVHEGMGLLVPPRDAAALREAIEWLLAHPAERQAMGQAAREHTAAEHSLEAMGRRWERVYRLASERAAVA